MSGALIAVELAIRNAMSNVKRQDGGDCTKTFILGGKSDGSIRLNSQAANEQRLILRRFLTTYCGRSLTQADYD